MKRLVDLKIGVRLNLILTVVFIVIFLGTAMYINWVQKRQIISDTDLRMEEQVSDLKQIFELQINERKNIIKSSMEMTIELLNNSGNIHINKNEILKIEAKNQITQSIEKIEIPTIYIGNEQIINHPLTEKITRLTNTKSTIFQKFSGGYIRMSTTIFNEDGTNAVGTYIPNDSPVAVAINKGEIYDSRAFVVNDWYTAIYTPIKNEDEVIGMIFIGIPEKDLPFIKSIFESKKYFDSGYPFVVDKEGTFVLHPKRTGENIAEVSFFKEMLDKKTGINKLRYEWEGKWKYQYFTYFEPIESFIAVSFYEEELFGLIRKVRNGILGAALIGIFFFVIANSQIAKSISSAINKMVLQAKQLSTGDLTETISLNQNDEIGQMAKSFDEMTSKLKEIVMGIQVGSRNVASASQQISSGAVQLSGGATEQASSTEEVTASMEEMTANIEQNKDNAQQAENIATRASEIMKKVENSGKRSLESIREISGKISIINDIAFQTNILALNAAVEAARAGEHGKGFAVVAAEVRKLAERSKLAADQIVNLAHQSLTNTEESDKLINALLPEIDKTVKLIQEINASSIEQNSGAVQINSAIMQLNTVTQQNASSSEELSSSSEELATEAIQLDEMVSFFVLNKNKTENRNLKQRESIQKSNSLIIENRKPLPKPGNLPKAEDDKEFESF